MNFGMCARSAAASFWLRSSDQQMKMFMAASVGVSALVLSSASEAGAGRVKAFGESAGEYTPVRPRRAPDF